MSLHTLIQVPWGGTVDFFCPAGEKLSFDNDTVFENDDKYSVICTTMGKYQVGRMITEYATMNGSVTVLALYFFLYNQERLNRHSQLDDL